MMHNTDQTSMVVPGKQQDMMRDAARERLASQLPSSRRTIFLARIYRAVLTIVGRWLVLSGSRFQMRADRLSEWLDTPPKTDVSVQKI